MFIICSLLSILFSLFRIIIAFIMLNNSSSFLKKSLNYCSYLLELFTKLFSNNNSVFYIIVSFFIFISKNTN